MHRERPSYAMQLLSLSVLSALVAFFWMEGVQGSPAPCQRYPGVPLENDFAYNYCLELERGCHMKNTACDSDNCPLVCGTAELLGGLEARTMEMKHK